ncbi:hypothetical protein JTB14_030976 [Gonioctena quinquepunctata]|nr:hypothetical protein JTB14_030976 [Gonioctena quinquepunctata]
MDHSSIHHSSMAELERLSFKLYFGFQQIQFHPKTSVTSQQTEQPDLPTAPVDTSKSGSSTEPPAREAYKASWAATTERYYYSVKQPKKNPLHRRGQTKKPL